MRADQISTPGLNLSEPINQSVTAANGGQFALMLSLMYEAQTAAALVSPPGFSAVQPEAQAALPGREFHLELGLKQSLIAGHSGHVNLMRSLVIERTQQVLAQLAPGIHSGETNISPHPQRRNEDLIDEIHKARTIGLRDPGVAQERISLRTGMAAL